LESGANIESTCSFGCTCSSYSSFKFNYPQDNFLFYANRIYHEATSLFVAAQEGHVETVEVLLNFGANNEATIKHGYSPLYVAARNGKASTAKLLLERGAKINSVGADGCM
jgi:ankyrin repeat protein